MLMTMAVENKDTAQKTYLTGCSCSFIATRNVHNIRVVALNGRR